MFNRTFNQGHQLDDDDEEGDEEEDDEEDSCVVYWKTKSILLPTTATSTLPLPPLPPPPPEHAKRSSRTALLPSPSSSKPHRAASRFSKRRKPDPVPSSSLDETTLRTLGALSARLNARSSASAPAVMVPGALSTKGDWAGGKGKAKQQSPIVARISRSSAPALTSLSNNTTPLTAYSNTRTSKPFSLPIPLTKPGPAMSCSNPSSVAPPPPPLPLSPPPPSPRATPIAAASDEYDSFLDGDDAFEFALSQLADPPTQPLPTPSPLSRSIPRKSPTVASRALATRPKPQPQPPEASTNRSTLKKSSNTLTKTVAGEPLIVHGSKNATELERKELEDLVKREMETLLDGAEAWSDVDEDF